MSKLKKLFFILSWIPLLAIKLLLAILGLVFVPIALLTRRLTLDSSIEADDHWPDMLWLWGNNEGCPEWWLTSCATGEEGKVAQWFPQWWWYAIRNPVNNFRFIFDDPEEYHTETNWGLEEPMEAQQMRNINRPVAFAWRWSGWKAGYRRVWLNDDARYSEIWFGWKVGSTVPGLGFTSQVRLKRKIGT